MQQIERYGIVALLLLVVSIVVVALWNPGTDGEGKPTVKAGERTERSGQETTSPVMRREEVARANGGAAMPLNRGASDSERRRGRPQGTETASTPSRPFDQERTASSRSPWRSSSSSGANSPASTAGARPTTAGSGAARTLSPPSGRVSTVPDQRQGQPPTRRMETRTDTTVRSSPDPVPIANVSRNDSARTTSAPPAAARTYVVKPGESLARIAKRELGKESRYREIADLNKIQDPSLIQAGMTLELPARDAAAPARSRTAELRPPSESKPAPTGTRKYVVGKGEVLSVIAQREVGSVKDVARILALNPKLDKDRIFAGATILLPVRGSEPSGRSMLAQATPTPKKTTNTRFRVQ